MHTVDAFDHHAPAPPDATARPNQHVRNIPPDFALQNACTTITLDRLRVAAHPGRGTRHIPFGVAAQNQVPETGERLHFNATSCVREGQQVGIAGSPIFVGLNAGAQGVAFQCDTVNVQNGDEARLRRLVERRLRLRRHGSIGGLLYSAPLASSGIKTASLFRK